MVKGGDKRKCGKKMKENKCCVMIREKKNCRMENKALLELI